MEIIRIDSDQLNIGKVGKVGEHNDTTLIFAIPEELLGYKIYDLEFEMASGRKIAIHDVKVENNELSLSLIDYILEYGSLYVEIVGYKFNPDIVTRSKTYVGFVERGINAAVEEICKKASLVAQLYKEIEELKNSIGTGGGGTGGDIVVDCDCGLPVAYINDDGELMFELAGDVVAAEINASGELELAVETEDGDKTFNLGKVKGRTPYFQLNDKVLEIKYDDESSWATLVDFSTIASSFDLRLNQDTYWLEAKREVDGEWEKMVDLSALKLAHEHTNKAVLDKFTEDIFKQAEDTIKKKHSHSNMEVLEELNENDLGNITDIPVIAEEVNALSDDVNELANRPLPEKQLVEGFNGNGLSANKDVIPTTNAWIGAGAASPLSGSREIKSTELKVVTTTANKTTTTTVSIDITWYGSYGAQQYFEKIMNYYSHASIVFADETDKTYYIALSKNNCSITNEVISLQFTFLSGYDTFPITGSITRAISTMKFYVAVGTYSHSEGSSSKAIGSSAHAEGWNTTAIDQGTHSEGCYTVAAKQAAHAEGFETEAKGYYSHAEGQGTIASGSA